MEKDGKSGVTITSINTKKLIAALAIGSLVLVSINKYYNYEYQGELWAPAYIASEDLMLGEDGEYYYDLEPGKHTMLVSRNDLFHYEIENIDGYMIQRVETDFWRDNIKIVYVNTKPVRVKLTDSNDTFSYFDEFGTIIEDEEIQKKLEKK